MESNSYCRRPLTTKEAVEDEIIRMGEALERLGRTYVGILSGVRVFEKETGQDVGIDQALQKMELRLVKLRLRINQQRQGR